MCDSWIYCVYNIPVYTILNSYSGVTRLLFCLFWIILLCKLWLASVFDMVWYGLWTRSAGHCDYADFNSVLFAVIMQVNISICDIFDIWYDFYDVYYNIYTFIDLKLRYTVTNMFLNSDISQTCRQWAGHSSIIKNIENSSRTAFTLRTVYYTNVHITHRVLYKSGTHSSISIGAVAS